MSTVFRSTATDAWKVAISTPVYTVDEQFLGVVALTVELGRLEELLGSKSNPRQFSVLVDGRAGPSRGVVLHHPLFARIKREKRELDSAFSTAESYRVPLDEMQEGAIYLDPIGQHPQGIEFRRKWIAAKREVFLDPAEHEPDAPSRNADTGLVVLVQEDYDLAAKAVHQLGNSLLRQGIAALSSVVLLLVILWYAVAKALGDSNNSPRRRGQPRSSPSTIHSMETIELPAALRK
jgi:hypothetical protein